MNAVERQMVQDLLVAVRDAATAIELAADTFSAEFLKEQERQKDRAIEAAYEREDRIDQYQSAMADKYVERGR